MRKLLSTILCLILVLSIVPMAMANADGQANGKQRVLVRFNGRANSQAIRELGGNIDHTFEEISTIATSLPPVAIDALKRNPNVAYVEPDAEVWATQITEEVLPWGVDRIDSGAIDGLAPVHSYNTGAGVKVAIIDTGIYYNHPDLAGRYIGGYDYVNDDYDPVDDNGHGTHVAGTIAAVLGNSIGVVGVAPDAQLYALKVLGSSGSGYTSDIVAALYWASNNGAKIASMSLGSNYNDLTLQAACDSVYNAGNGLLLVAAAGNDYKKIGTRELDTVDYPARYSSVIAVAATDSKDAKASFSSTGPAVELAAPGVEILSTYPSAAYATGSGTSMACPHVSGAAALIWAGEPSLTAGQVRQRLIETADDLGSAGRDNWYGYGIIDVDEAAHATGPQPPIANAGPDLTVTAGDAGVATVTLDGSASFDPDGFIVSYVWEEGATVLGTAPILTSSFSVGSHTVTLTVTDNQGNSDSDDAVVTVNAYVAPQGIGVASITLTPIRTANKGYVTATVTIKDSNGDTVSGATVYGQWSGATSGSVRGVTDSTGEVTFKSASVKSPTDKTFTFAVTNLAKTGCEYDKTLNYEDSPKESLLFP